MIQVDQLESEMEQLLDMTREIRTVDSLVMTPVVLLAVE